MTARIGHAKVDGAWRELPGLRHDASGEKRIVPGGQAESLRVDPEQRRQRAGPPVVVLRTVESVEGRGCGVVELEERPRRRDTFEVDPLSGFGKTASNRKRLRAQRVEKGRDVNAADSGFEVPGAG